MRNKQSDEFESAIERAVQPGTYVGYREITAFIEAMEGLRAQVTSLIPQAGKSARSVALLELFIAGCFEKAEDVDDSSGEFGRFVCDLFCDWIRARQAAGADAEETVKSLHSWIGNDDYGFCYGLETVAVGVLDKSGLRALAQTARDVADASAKGSYTRLHNIGVLKAIHVKKGDVPAYQSLCEAEEDLAPADCEKLAEMLLKKRKFEEALTWVERGLELAEQPARSGRTAWGLPGLKRKILMRLGRGEEAIASAFGDYCRTPSTYSYADLMAFVPVGERSRWHQKALSELEGADLDTQIDLLVAMKEWGLLASLVESTPRAELVGLSHYTTDPAARKLMKAYPLLAAKLEVAMALRILEAMKSRYYDSALRNLDRARKAMLKNGRAEEWEALATEIRTNHRRKSAFLPGFDRLAERCRTREQSFSERARERSRKGSKD